MNGVAFFAKCVEQADITRSGKGRLEGEVFLPVHDRPNLAQEEASGIHGGGIGIERGESPGEIIGIDEGAAIRDFGEEFKRKGCFPRAVWPGDDINRRLFFIRIPHQDFCSSHITFDSYPPSVPAVNQGMEITREALIIGHIQLEYLDGPRDSVSCHGSLSAALSEHTSLTSHGNTPQVINRIFTFHSNGSQLPKSRRTNSQGNDKTISESDLIFPFSQFMNILRFIYHVLGGFSRQRRYAQSSS